MRVYKRIKMKRAFYIIWQNIRMLFLLCPVAIGIITMQIKENTKRILKMDDDTCGCCCFLFICIAVIIGAIILHFVWVI